MNVTAEHAGGAVVLELDEGCRSVAALRRIISAALPDVREDGFDVTVARCGGCGCVRVGRDTIQVVVRESAVALDALRAAGRDVSEDGLNKGICDAVQAGALALCEQYLDAGCDVNALDGDGRALLHVAASRSYPDLCTLLLQRGADVNKRDGGNATPLNRCRRWEHSKQHAVREVLLRHGADMHAASRHANSPFAYARALRNGIFGKRDRAARAGRSWQRHGLSPFNAYGQYVKYGAPSMRWSNPCQKEYSRDIQKLAKVQFKERKQQITWKGMRIVNAFVTDVLERLGGEAGRVTSFSGAKTLSVRSVVAAVKLQLPEELATHALAAGTAAVGRYAKACGGR